MGLINIMGMGRLMLVGCWSNYSSIGVGEEVSPPSEL
jgi:hypothetical protein